MKNDFFPFFLNFNVENLEKSVKLKFEVDFEEGKKKFLRDFQIIFFWPKNLFLKKYENFSKNSEFIFKLKRNNEIQNICWKIFKFEEKKKIFFDFEKILGLEKNFKLKACLRFSIDNRTMSGFEVHSVEFDNGYVPKRTGIHSCVNAKVFEVELN